jgi:hypothetical protein
VGISLAYRRIQLLCHHHIRVLSLHYSYVHYLASTICTCAYISLHYLRLLISAIFTFIDTTICIHRLSSSIPSIQPLHLCLSYCQDIEIPLSSALLTIPILVSHPEKYAFKFPLSLLCRTTFESWNPSFPFSSDAYDKTLERGSNALNHILHFSIPIHYC